MTFMQLTLLLLNRYPIFDQLKLEEALLRTTSGNWLILNLGSTPAVVMGISGKADDLVHISECKKANIPIIKRYSGGGTVVVDENTLFFSLIVQKEKVFDSSSPREIMKWIEGKIKPAFPSTFALTENDFTLEDKKIGGNAQYLQKDRWLHHTTFLFDYHPERMATLKIPSKKPLYRGDRPHSDFITTLKAHYPNMEDLAAKLMSCFAPEFNLQITSLNESLTHLEKPHRSSTQYVDFL
jgi:lipoate-protein ligase A